MKMKRKRVRKVKLSMTGFVAKFLSLLLVAFCSLRVGAEITQTPDQLFQVDKLKFGLMHWDMNWNNVYQFLKPNSVAFPGEGAVQMENQLRRYGTFRVANGEFRLMEGLERISENEVRIRVELSSEDGVPTSSLAWGARIPSAELPLESCTWNGAPLNWVSGKEEQSFTLKPNIPFQITLSGGVLEIYGNLTLIVRRPKSEKGFTEFRLRLPGYRTTVRNSALSFRLKYIPFSTMLLDLKSQMTMGFRDEVAEDRKGGWTDQGPANDLSPMTPGTHEYSGIRFLVVDPMKNGGNSVLAFRGKERPYFQERAEFALPGGTKGRYLYLLNGVAWAPVRDTVCGIVELGYVDGSIQQVDLKCGRDTGNFWQPKHLENANVGWRNANSSTNIGLYVTRIHLEEGKEVKTLTFRSADQVWMVLAATVTDAEMNQKETFTPTKLQADRNWMPMPDSLVVEKGSVLDCSHLLHAPAGKFGFLKTVGENFEFEGKAGTPARFWGTNVCLSAMFTTNELIDLMLDQLAAQGCNLLRLHHFDRQLYAADSTLNEHELERLDYLFAGAKKRGIYLTLDFYTLRTIEGVPSPKLSFYFDRDFREKFLDSALLLMNHQNAYTGITWKEDPALVFISIVNEGTLTFLYQRASKEFKAEQEAAFQKFATENNWSVTEKNRDAQFTAWLRHLAAEAYRETHLRMRQAGVRVPFSDQSFHSHASVTQTRRLYDYVDMHFYWGHPTYVGKNRWSAPYMVSPSSSIRSGGGIHQVFQSRLSGKPFAITEWNYCYPNRFGGEGPFLVGAYSALQNYGALTQFAFAHKDRMLEGKEPLGPFDYANHPVIRLGMRAGAFAFLRGDVAASEIEVPVYQPEEYWMIPSFRQSSVPETLGLVVKTGTAFTADSPAFQAILFPDAVSVPGNSRVPVVFGNERNVMKILAEKEVLPAGNVDWNAGRFTSSTGELELNKKQETFRSVTARSESFLLPGGKSGDGKFVSIVNRRQPASFLVASLEEKPLTESRRILILHLTDVKSDGAVFRDPEMAILEQTGTPRLLVLRGEAELIVNSTNFGTLYACDVSGRRLFEVPAKVEDGRSIYTLKTDSGQGPVLAYELIR